MYPPTQVGGGGLSCHTCNLEFLEDKYLQEHLTFRDHLDAIKVGSTVGLDPTFLFCRGSLIFTFFFYSVGTELLPIGR